MQLLTVLRLHLLGDIADVRGQDLAYARIRVGQEQQQARGRPRLQDVLAPADPATVQPLGSCRSRSSVE